MSQGTKSNLVCEGLRCLQLTPLHPKKVQLLNIKLGRFRIMIKNVCVMLRASFWQSGWRFKNNLRGKSVEKDLNENFDLKLVPIDSFNRIGKKGLQATI